MDAAPGRPDLDLALVADAQARFNRAIAGLTDDDARRSTALPGWTVGHVLTHLARNADSHRRRADAAVRGEVIEQYTGGFDGRAAEIDAGAGRSATELVIDVRHSAEQLGATWEALPETAWGRHTTDVGGRMRPLGALPGRRWQELEVHLVDLGLRPTHRDWSDDFVGAFLPRLRASLDDRLGGAATPTIALDSRDELAWLYGRLERPDLPRLPPWG